MYILLGFSKKGGNRICIPIWSYKMIIFLTEESKQKQTQADLIGGNIEVQKLLKESTA